MFQDSQTSTPVKQPKLLDQLRAAFRTRHYSMKTEEAYVYWIKRFILCRKSMGTRLRLCSSFGIGKKNCGLTK